MNSYSGTDNLEIMAEAVNYNAFLLRLVASHLRPGQRVLDFGAGIGLFAELVAAKGADLVCLEPDPDQAAVIAGKNLAVIQNLDVLPDGSLDYVYSLNVLEHIDDDVGALRAIYRKMRPGAALLIYVPAFPMLFSQMDRKVGHFRRYRKQVLRAAAQTAGFRCSRVTYADSLGFLATLAYKMVGDQSGTVNKAALITYDRFVFPISRALDRVFGGLVGKNLLLIGKK